MLGDDRLPARGDGLNRLVPGNPLKLPGALGTHTLEWVKDALVAVDPLLVVVDLDTQTSAGERMIGVAPHRDGLSVLNGRQDRAGVRAIMWACTNYRGTGHGFLRFVIQRSVETAAMGTGWLLRICGVLFLNCGRPGGLNASGRVCLFLAHLGYFKRRRGRWTRTSHFGIVVA